MSTCWRWLGSSRPASSEIRSRCCPRVNWARLVVPHHAEAQVDAGPEQLGHLRLERGRRGEVDRQVAGRRELDDAAVDQHVGGRDGAPGQDVAHFLAVVRDGLLRVVPAAGRGRRPASRRPVRPGAGLRRGAAGGAGAAPLLQFVDERGGPPEQRHGLAERIRHQAGGARRRPAPPPAGTGTGAPGPGTRSTAASPCGRPSSAGEMSRCAPAAPSIRRGRRWTRRNGPGRRGRSRCRRPRWRRGTRRPRPGPRRR